MQAQVKNGFPRYERQARELVAEHEKIQDEPLLLAVYFAPDRDAGDVFLLEVVEGFGGNQVAPERDLFEVTYGPSSSFPLEAGHRLHLILTNPAEIRQAMAENWSPFNELRQAKQRGNWRVVYSTPEGASIEERV